MLLPALSKAKAKALGSKPVPITTAQLFPYIKNLAIYRCPSDRSVAFGEPRVRSVAASQAFYASAQPLGGHLSALHQDHSAW